MALYLPIGTIKKKSALGWSRYRDANPVPTSSLDLNDIYFILYNHCLVVADVLFAEATLKYLLEISLI